MDKIRERYLAEIAREAKSVKNYADTYLYNKGNYEKKIFDFMMHTEYVDKTSTSFSDIKFDVKRRQVTSSLIKVLESNQTMLCINTEAMPRAFKVFVAKDVKGDGDMKVFIDVTGIIKLDNGRYTYQSADIDILISYLLSAMNAKIYHTDPGRIVNRYALVDEGNKCFSSMFYYIIDYLRIAGSIDNGRGKCAYLTSKYYQLNILGRAASMESINARALKLSGLSQREADMLEIHLDGIKDPYKDIDTFINTIAKIFKTKKLTLDVFMDKWMWIYGYGTQFGLELYPAFSTILINTYVGAYLNNQKTIEKVVGKPLVDFINELFKLGSELV